MKIWECMASDYFGEVITMQFDDRDILLDCICDTREEMIKYMIDRCLSYCKAHKMNFLSMAIIAE